jgi:crotonobetainyl-CoA:carnitine CoA-transferase CaiB-like acyl-CoA transferase
VSEARGGLLEGIRILDFGIWRPVPYTTQLLADLGADVLKVEPPGGDPMRGFAELYATISAHKRSIELDLKSPDDLARALELAADADVVTEGFRPGVAARLGIGPEQIRAVNPDVVYLSLSGFGQDGPMRLAPGHDLGYQAVAGTLVPEGGEPSRSSIPWADVAGGLVAAFAVCAALVRRLGHGDGEVIDVAMTDILATWTGSASGAHTAVPGKRLAGLPGYGVFRCLDGWIALSGITEQHFWTATCDGLGLADVRDLPMLEQVERTRSPGSPRPERRSPRSTTVATCSPTHTCASGARCSTDPTVARCSRTPCATPITPPAVPTRPPPSTPTTAKAGTSFARALPRRPPSCRCPRG